jgi:hypothetical protein
MPGGRVFSIYLPEFVELLDDDDHILARLLAKIGKVDEAGRP